MKYATLSLSAAVLLISLGCSTQPVTNYIAIPAAPVFPVLTEEQESSITKDAYEVIGDREEIFKAYIRSLKGRIEENNSRAQ